MRRADFPYLRTESIEDFVQKIYLIVFDVLGVAPGYDNVRDILRDLTGNSCFLDGEFEARRYGYADFEAFITSEHMVGLVEVEYSEGRPVFFRAIPQDYNRTAYEAMNHSRRVAERRAMRTRSQSVGARPSGGGVVSDPHLLRVLHHRPLERTCRTLQRQPPPYARARSQAAPGRPVPPAVSRVARFDELGNEHWSLGEDEEDEDETGLENAPATLTRRSSAAAKQQRSNVQMSNGTNVTRQHSAAPPVQHSHASPQSPAAQQTQSNGISSARPAAPQTQSNGTSSARPAAPLTQSNGTSSARPAAPQVSVHGQTQRRQAASSNGSNITQQRSAAPPDPHPPRGSEQQENRRVVLDPAKYTNLNLPADDSNLPDPPIQEISPNDAQVWIYLRSRLIVSAWRAKPGTLQLAQLHADIIVEDPTRVPSFLHHTYDGDLRLFIERHLPMLRVFKLGPEFHVLWNSEYVREHPNWAEELQQDA